MWLWRDCRAAAAKDRRRGCYAVEPARLGAVPPSRTEARGSRPGLTGNSGEEARRTAARERGAAGTDHPAERGHPAHQRQPRPEHRSAGGRRKHLRAHRRPLRRDHDPRRGRAGPGLRHLRHHAPTSTGGWPPGPTGRGSSRASSTCRRRCACRTCPPTSGRSASPPPCSPT